MSTSVEGGPQAPACLIAIGQDPGHEQASGHSFSGYFENCCLLSLTGQLANSLSHHFYCFRASARFGVVRQFLDCPVASLALPSLQRTSPQPSILAKAIA